MARRAEDFDPRCQWAANATGSNATINVGDIITFRSEVRDDKKQVLVFPRPNPTALYLHFAEQTYQECKKTSEIARNGQGHTASESAVFDFIEKRMAVVIFAFSALEAFANEYIPPDYQHEHERDSGLIVFKDKKHIERWYSLETKLFELLPGILKVEAPKRGTRIHNRYLALQRLRDRIIHCTAEDRMSTGPDDKSLWNALLGKTFRDFAADAAEIIAYFVSTNPRKVPRWLWMRNNQRDGSKN